MEGMDPPLPTPESTPGQRYSEYSTFDTNSIIWANSDVLSSELPTDLFKNLYLCRNSFGIGEIQQLYHSSTHTSHQISQMYLYIFCAPINTGTISIRCIQYLCSSLTFHVGVWIISSALQVDKALFSAGPLEGDRPYVISHRHPIKNSWSRTNLFVFWNLHQHFSAFCSTFHMFSFFNCHDFYFLTN